MGDVTVINRLLDDAADALERSNWAAALDLAEEIARLDPDNEDAAAIRTLARLRSRRRVGRGPGSRRQLTVLFCDLVESTALAAALDPEETREVLLTFQRACAEVIARYEGYVAQYIGDGVLAYFGYPRAHEDDPVRAVLAGRAIVEAVQDLAPVRHGDGLTRLAVRVGIHTGLVVVADMGAPGRTHPDDIVGETPNIASRIHGTSAPDTVVISGETAALIGEMFDLRSLPVAALKGVPRPVALFEVVGDRPFAGRSHTRVATPLVGRTAECDAIVAAWDDAVAASGPRMLAIIGDPGIGKSRLVNEAKARAERAGAVQLTLQCSPYHLSTPLFPVTSLLGQVMPASGLRTFLEDLGDDNAEDEYVLSRLLGVPPRPGLSVHEVPPDTVRERSFAIVLAWLTRLARNAPLLLAVEDLHWADPTTLELLGRVVSRAGLAPVLVLGTSRERSPLRPLGDVPVLSLGPLRPADAGRIVDHVAPAVPTTIRSLIVDHSDGVPLFVEELTRMIGTADSDGADASGINAFVTEVPTTLQDLLVARIDQYLTEQRVAQVVATVGHPVPRRVLERIVGLDPDELTRQLDTLVDARLLEALDSEGGEPFYQFRHVLQRDAAYELQLRSVRRATHAAVAEALIDEAERGAVAPELLAYHYEQAGDHSGAALQWHRAGLAHASVAAHAEAIEHYRRALAACQQAPSAPRADFELDVQSGLAGSLLAARGYTSDEVADAYRRLRALSADSGAAHHFPSLYGMWAYYHVRGRNDVSAGLAGRLVRLATASAAENDLLAAKAVLGYQELWGGRFRSAVDLLEQASTWASEEPSPLPHHPGVGASINLAAALWMLGCPTRSGVALADGLARAETLDGPLAEFTRAFSYCFAAALCHIAGDVAGCAAHANRAIEISSAHGFASWLGAGMLHAGITGALSGDPNAFIPGIRLALDAWRECGAESNRTHFLFGLAQGLARAGRVEEALAAVDEALAQADATAELFLVSPLRCLRADLLRLVAPADPGAVAAELAVAATVAAEQEALGFEIVARRRLQALATETGVGEDDVGDVEALLARFDDPLGGEPYLAAAGLAGCGP